MAYSRSREGKVREDVEEARLKKEDEPAPNYLLALAQKLAQKLDVPRHMLVLVDGIIFLRKENALWIPDANSKKSHEYPIHSFETLRTIFRPFNEKYTIDEAVTDDEQNKNYLDQVLNRFDSLIIEDISGEDNLQPPEKAVAVQEEKGTSSIHAWDLQGHSGVLWTWFFLLLFFFAATTRFGRRCKKKTWESCNRGGRIIVEASLLTNSTLEMLANLYRERLEILAKQAKKFLKGKQDEYVFISFHPLHQAITLLINEKTTKTSQQWRDADWWALDTYTTYTDWREVFSSEKRLFDMEVLVNAGSWKDMNEDQELNDTGSSESAKEYPELKKGREDQEWVFDRFNETRYINTDAFQYPPADDSMIHMEISEMCLPYYMKIYLDIK